MPNWDALRNELLAETVQQAVSESPLFADLYRGLDWRAVERVEDLPVLPILTREASFGGNHLVRSLQVGAVQFTSGSTGQPKVIYRSRQELDFIARFFGEANSPHSRHPTPLAVHLPPMQHGVSTPIPGSVLSIPSSVASDGLLTHTIQLLHNTFSAPDIAERVSLLSGGQTEVVTLTQALLDLGIHRNELAVESVHMTGRSLTSRLRSILEEYWGVQVVDRFSMAEVFGGATWCVLCRAFHFDPMIIPEIVDSNGNPSPACVIGRLILSCLNPFVQMLPLLRYDSGDLARGSATVCGQMAFEHMGREAHALVDGKGTILLTGLEIEDELDKYPNVARSSHFEELKLVSDHTIGGRAACRGRILKSDGKSLDLLLEVEVKNSLAGSKEALMSLQRSLMEAMLLKDYERRVNLTVVPVERGTLPPRYKRSRLWSWS